MFSYSSSIPSLFFSYSIFMNILYNKKTCYFFSTDGSFLLMRSLFDDGSFLLLGIFLITDLRENIGGWGSLIFTFFLFKILRVF